MKLEKREYICDICKQSFRRRRYFVQHFRRHTQKFDGANNLNLMNLLPKNWNYIVKSYEPHTQKNNFDAVVLAPGLSSSDHIKEWMKEFMSINKCNYILKYLDSRESRFAKSKHVYACRYLSRKSNKLSCQSCIRFTIRRNYENSAYFGIIHIKFIHNHSPDCAAILRYRTPSEDVQKYFRSMFENGFSPSQAYNSYKQHLYVQCSNNYDEAIVDRGVNPDKRWVYYFYQKLLKEKHGPTAAEQMITSIRTSVNEFNERHEQNYCHYAQVDENNFAIVVLTPLMIRALRLPAAASTIYIDCESQVSRYGLHVFLLFIGSRHIGGIPVGVVITSDDGESVILRAFQYYCSLLEGVAVNPRVLVAVDSPPLLKALRTLFPAACLLLNVFQILEAGWKWLWKLENAIDAKCRKPFYGYLQRMAYCAQPQLLEVAVAEALADGRVQPYKNFQEYVRRLYSRRYEWSVCVQECLQPNGQHLVDDCVKIFKEKIFKKLKSHNPAQLFYYIIGDYNTYYERKLYDLAVNGNCGQVRRQQLMKSNAIGQQEMAKYRFEYIAESVVMLTNVKKKVHYVVNEDISVCSCYLGEVGLVCKHLMMVNSRGLSGREGDQCGYTLSEDERQQLYFVADGSTTMPNKNMVENQVILVSEEEIQLDANFSDEDDSSLLDDDEEEEEHQQQHNQYQEGVQLDDKDHLLVEYSSNAADAMKEEIVLILNEDLEDSNGLNAFIVVKDEEEVASAEADEQLASTFGEFQTLMASLASRLRNDLPYYRGGLEVMNAQLKELLERSDEELQAALSSFGKGCLSSCSSSP